MITAELKRIERFKEAIKQTNRITHPNSMWVLTDNHTTSTDKLRYMTFCKLFFFKRLCDPAVLEVITLDELEDRINSCNIIIGLYKTKTSIKYKEWVSCRDRLLNIYNSVDLESTVKFFTSKKPITPSVYKTLLGRCNSIIENKVDKKEKKGWIKLKAEVISAAADLLHDGNSSISTMLEEISAAKRTIRENTIKLEEAKKAISWAEKIFTEKVIGDGSCDDCYYLNNRVDCDTKECEGGKFIFKLKSIEG